MSTEAFRTWLCRNPLVERFAFAQLRPRSFVTSVAMYAVMVVLLLLFNGAGHRHTSAEDYWKAYRAIHYQFIVFQILTLWIGGMHYSASVIRDEINERSIDFFRLLPLTPGEKVTGILIGRNLVLWMFVIANAALALVFGALGDIQGRFLVEEQVSIVLTGVTLMMAAVLASTYDSRKKKSSGGAGFLVLGVFILPYIIGMIAEAFDEQPGTWTVRFFGHSLRAMVVMSGVAAYFAGWSYRGLLRRFTREREPLFTAAGAALFLAGIIGIMLGFSWHVLGEEDGRWVYALWFFSLLVMLCLPFGMMRKFEDYQEALADGADEGLWGLLLRIGANPLRWLWLVAVWLVGALAAASAGPIPTDVYIPRLLLFLSFVPVFYALIEAYVLWLPLNNRAGMAAAFVAVLLLIVPLILGGILDSEELVRHSLFAAFGMSMDEPMALKGGEWVVLAANLFFGVLAVFPLLSRYNALEPAAEPKTADREPS